MAVRWTLEHIHNLDTHHFILLWLTSFKNVEGHMTHWIQHLQEYNFTYEHCQCSFPKTMLRRVYSAKKSGIGRWQTGASYVSCSQRQMGPSHPEEDAAEQPTHTTDYTRNRGWTMSGMERYCWPHPHAQKQLGLIEVSCSKGWCTGTLLRVSPQMTQNRPDSPHSKQSEGCTNLGVSCIFFNDLPKFQYNESQIYFMLHHSHFHNFKLPSILHLF
jgi:hypothetical protein